MNNLRTIILLGFLLSFGSAFATLPAEPADVQTENNFLVPPHESKAVSYYDSGQVKSVYTLKRGRLHGDYYLYHRRGTLKESGLMKKGKRHGKVTFFYKNGQKQSEGKFKKGKEKGKWTYWNRSGKRTKVSRIKR